MSDEEVLKLSIKQPQAFAILVERYQEAFQRKSERILGNEVDAEDAVQDAFVKIYINAARFQPQPGASFKSWAYKVLLNVCFTRYRKNKVERERVVALDPELAELISVESNLTEKNLDKDFLLSALSKLPEILRRALHLHFIDGMPQKTVARIEGVSEGAIRARIHRGKEELKRYSYEY